MAKRVNKKLVAGLTVGAFAAVIAVSVLMIKQLQSKDPQRYVVQAEHWVGEEDWRQAAFFYRRAWEAGEDASYLVELGQMLLNDGDFRKAVAAWRQALSHSPQNTDAHERMLRVLMEVAELRRRTADYLTVRDAAVVLLDVDPGHAYGHHTLGTVLVRLADQDEANAQRGLAELKRAVELAPEVIDYALTVAAYYIELGRVDESDALLDGLIVRFDGTGSDASKARTAKAVTLARRGETKAALPLFEEAVTRAGEDVEARLTARLAFAGFLRQQWFRKRATAPDDTATEALFARAKNLYEESISDRELSYLPYLGLAELYNLKRRHSDAVRVCEVRLAKGITRKGLSGPINQAYTFQLNNTASKACLFQAREVDDAVEKEAWLDRAHVFVTDALSELAGKPEGISQRGQVRLLRGDERGALEDFVAAEAEFATRGRVDWPNTMMLARLHLQLKEPGAAKQALERVLDDAREQRPKDGRFWSLYAQILLQTNDLNGAINTANIVLGFEPGNETALRIKAAVYDRRGQPDQAGEILEQTTGSEAIVVLLKAEALRQEGDWSGAVDILRGALEEDPGNLRIVIPTVQSLAYLERNDEAMRVIAAAREANPDAPELRKLEVIVRPGLTPEERDAALLEVINDEPDAFKRALERAGFHRQRREYAETMANIDDAERHLIARDTPMARAASKSMHRSMLEQKLRAAVALGDTAAVKAVRDAARRHNVDGVVGKTILGISHLLLEEYEPAIVAFSEALQVQPSDARTWTNLGRCHDRSGRFADAVSCYGRAVEIDPNDVLAHRGLAQLALRRGETATFEHHLAECERLRSKDPWIQSQLTARKDHEDPLAAIARREKLLEDDPDDFDNIRQLAGLAERVRDFERADKYCDRLLEIRPDEQLLVNAIAKYHRRLGRPERSLELVRANIERRTTPEQRAAAHVFLASHYHGLGDIEQAEAALLAGVDVAETLDLTRELAVFYYRLKQPAKALHWFDKCVVLARDAKSPRLPQILAARIECLLQPGLDDVATARQRVEELLRDHPEEPVALTLNGEVYAREGHLDEAISSLTRFLRLRPHDTRVLYKRALLYLSLGDQPAAIADLEAIRQADPDVREVEARRQLARLYEQSGETDRAIAALEALRAAAPDSLAVFADYVQLLIRSERLADADRAVTTALNEAGNQALPSLHRLRGRVSLALGDTNKALEDYLRAAETGDFASTIMPHVLAMFIEAERYDDGAAFFEAHEHADRRTGLELARCGRLLAKAGRASEAVARFRSAVDLASRESREALLGARAELADAWTSADAIPLFESEVSDGGAARANERILAHLQLREGRVAKAVALIDGLIGSSQSDHDRAELWFEKGVFQLASDPPGARKSFEEAIRINPADWQAINNLAVVLSDNLGQHEQALRYAQEAVAKSGSPSTRDTLGWIQVKLGRFSDAVANLAHAIRLDPTSVEAHFHLGEAYRLSGRYVQSQEILRQGLKLAQDQDMADLKTRIESALAKSTRSDGAR